MLDNELHMKIPVAHLSAFPSFTMTLGMGTMTTMTTTPGYMAAAVREGFLR
jgi:hypothetical protein